MKDLTEIRWHGRGGQGAVTAAKILAESAIRAGSFIQAFPEYGPERAGAPVRSFTRISKGPIYTHSQITNPDIVLVLDATLLDTVDVTEGLSEEGALIVNTPESPSAIREKLGIKKAKVYTVNATDIAIKELKRNIPNTPMIAAIARATGIVGFEAVKKSFEENYSKKFKKEIIEANLRAMDAAYKLVKSEQGEIA